MLPFLTRILLFFILLTAINACKKDEIEKAPEEKTFQVDPEFEKELVRQQIDNAVNGLLRESEIKNVEKLNLNSVSGLKSLKGIEYFENLKELAIFDVKIDSLDLSKNTKLEYLYCRTIGIEGGYSSLAYLNVKNCKALKYLDCSYNKLTEIDVSGNPALTFLGMSVNVDLKEIDLSANVALDSLECFMSHSLTKLDLSKNTSLSKINCQGTPIQSLDLSMLSNLKTLDIRYSGISDLKLKTPTVLEELEITGSKVSFPDPSIFPKVHTLHFGAGQFSMDLTSLPDLKTLYVANVNAPSINLSGNKNLKALTLFESGFTSLDLSKNVLLNELSLFKLEKLTTLDLSHAGDLTFFSSFQSKNLKTICVSKLPDASVLYWQKDDWSAYVVCK